MYLRYLTDDVFISILASIHKHREHMPSMMMLLSNGFPFNKDRSLLRRTTNHWMSSSKKAISEMALYCRYTHVYCSTTWMDLEWWSWEKSQWIISSLGWLQTCLDSADWAPSFLIICCDDALCMCTVSLITYVPFRWPRIVRKADQTCSPFTLSLSNCPTS